MPHLEPTYLRYIYDGLVKGSIHPENAAELPEGLIGLYEEVFDERTSVDERQKLLERFAIWALLKKEVSAAFVAEVLGETEDDIQDFISTYSAWFNSPESGKYQLYHERLKVYLLQKLSEGEVVVLNKRIIQFLLLQFTVFQKNESVLYCYQYLSFHTFVAAKINSDSALLCELCLSNSFKKRQFDLSGFYDWEEQLMLFGVEHFALIEGVICHEIVFEKTKIQYKKKDIDLILSLIRSGEMETVFRFFQNISETNLYARVELAYFYFLSFFEIFERGYSNFVEKKEMASKLLEIFQDNFQWDTGYYLSQFVDVNISFRIHCYFEQFGLNYKSIAILSSDQVSDYFDLQMDEPLKFIGRNHLDEAKSILKDFKKFDYGRKDVNLEGIVYSGYEIADEINEKLEEKISNFTKTQLIRDELAYSSDIVESFDELYSFILLTLRKLDIIRDLKLKVLRGYKNIANHNSSGLYSIQGNIENSDGKNTLTFIINDFEQLKQERLSLPEWIEIGLDIDRFLSIDLKKQYQLLLNENLNSDDDIELMLFLLEVSEYYQNNKPSAFLELFSALLVEFHLNMNEELIDEYMDELIDLISSSSEASEEFEGKVFVQLLDFFNRSDVNGQRKRNLKIIQETLMETFLDFSFYNYSFVAGCHLINLFSKFKIEFSEKEIVNRIIDDLNNLIEENDYNEIFEIEGSRIKNIFEKPYFWEFYNAVKQIHIEQVRLDLSEYIFESIIKVKGLNHNTVSFFRENTNEFPGMYIWAQNRLSQKLLEKNEELSYVVIKDNNDLLLERLLLNIVSKRENLKDELNIQILKHYGLDWVIELDNEYEKLIVN